MLPGVVAAAVAMICFAAPISGKINGVGSSVAPLSPGAPLLSVFASAPLSDLSVATIGFCEASVIVLPFESVAVPPPIAWLNRGCDRPLTKLSGSIFNVNVTRTCSPGLKIPVPSNRFCVGSANHNAFSPGAVPPSDTPLVSIAKLLLPCHAVDNCDCTSSKSVGEARSTVPVFSTNSSKSMFQVPSASCDGVPVCCFATPRSAMKTGVGSLLPPVSTGSSMLFDAGSAPLSESSVADNGDVGIVVMSSPATVAWLFR